MHVNGKLRLGDNKTEVNVTERIKIDVVLRAPDQQHVTAVVDFLLCMGYAWYGYDNWITGYLGPFLGSVGNRARNSAARQARRHRRE